MAIHTPSGCLRNGIGLFNHRVKSPANNTLCAVGALNEKVCFCFAAFVFIVYLYSTSAVPLAPPLLGIFSRFLANFVFSGSRHQGFKKRFSGSATVASKSEVFTK